MKPTVVNIPRRYRGPPESANGGYACGLLGTALNGGARVRLMVPPPLEQTLVCLGEDDVVELRDGDRVVARAVPGDPGLVPPPAPDPEAAREAASRYSGFDQHWFPGCFVCGPERAEDDGLRIFAGPMADGSGVAAPWRPAHNLSDGHGRVDPLFAWAALDCPGAFAFTPAHGKAVVLGELCGRVDGDLSPGEPCTVRGWAIDHEGRKHHVGTAIYGADGECRAVARATWIEIPYPVD